MSDERMTSTGHTVSDAPWLDLHFQTTRAEYEDALRFVGIEPGLTVLDAGFGSGGYVPLLCELVGSIGRVAALDLAPENVAQVGQFVSMGLRYQTGFAAEDDIPLTDCEALRSAAADPDRLLDNPDFYLREAFVVTVGRVLA